MDVRFEVWTRPDSGTFARQFPLVTATDFQLQLGIWGSGLLALPSTDPRLDDLLYVDPADHSNDQASIIRAYVGDVHFYDFYPARMNIDPNETGTRIASVTGGGLGTRMGTTRIRQYDYPDESPQSVEADWRYGFGPNILLNGSVEELPAGVINPGGEEESTIGWYTTADEFGFNAPSNFEAIEGPGARTGDWYFQVTGNVFAGVRQDFPTVEDETYTVSVWVSALVGQQFRLSCDGAKSVVTGTGFNNSTYVDGVGTNAYVQFTVAFVADDSGTGRIHITSRATGQTFNFDDVNVDGFGLGVEPWRAFGSHSVFEGSTTYSQTGPTSMAFRPTSGIAGNDPISQSIQVVQNSTVYAQAAFFHTEAAARLFRLVIRKPGVNPNTSNVASVQVLVQPSTWTTIRAEGFSTGGTVEVELRWDESSIPVGTLYADSMQAFQGRAAATAGKIVGDQLTAFALGTRNALAHLTPTFTDGLDSSGAAWNQNLAIVVKRGQTFRRLMDVLLNDYGYEARVRANPADDTVLWFDLYNPGNMGTDFTTGDGGAVTSAGMVSFGPIIRREPRATYAMVEGEDQYWGESENTTLKAVWGDIEDYQGTEELLFGTLDQAADEYTTGVEAQTVTAKFVNPPRVPGIDYTIGDKVILMLGDDVLPTGTYRVVDISLRQGSPEPMFQVQFVEAA